MRNQDCCSFAGKHPIRANFALGADPLPLQPEGVVGGWPRMLYAMYSATFISLNRSGRHIFGFTIRSLLTGRMDGRFDPTISPTAFCQYQKNY